MKHIKLFENFNDKDGYALDSVNMYINKKTLMLYPIVNGNIDKTKGVSLNDQDDEWFSTLDDNDFGTIDNILNSNK